ncbi:hypothetical protein ABE41_006850 [Fictibacillus arsenicus]|uniref:Uncharacterized protein n=1 Tax=Fictibacillus arsenicus TaxID=255247 RepID=A0A1B1Z2N6_9BACL|nr:hypothetical protein ABE41_006850 [Fictibacillus arsenicus]
MYPKLELHVVLKVVIEEDIEPAFIREVKEEIGPDLKPPLFPQVNMQTTLSHNPHITLTKRSQNSFVMCFLLFYHLYWEKI